MSRAFVVLGITVLGTAATIAYVHYDQEREIARMRKSVFADAIREQERRRALAAGQMTTGEKADDKSSSSTTKSSSSITNSSS